MTPTDALIEKMAPVPLRGKPYSYGIDGVGKFAWYYDGNGDLVGPYHASWATVSAAYSAEHEEDGK